MQTWWFEDNNLQVLSGTQVSVALLPVKFTFDWLNMPRTGNSQNTLLQVPYQVLNRMPIVYVDRPYYAFFL